jgi:hypothetical protein
MKFIRNKIEFVVFDRQYCKTLLDSNKIKEAKAYIKYFFFNYGNKIFFFNGLTFILYTREETLKLIPDDLKVEVTIPNQITKKFETVEISIKAYLKSTEFMNTNYKPTIDFTKDLIFREKVRFQKFEFLENNLNMAKPLNHNIITGYVIVETNELKQNLQTINKSNQNNYDNILIGLKDLGILK